MFALSYHKVVKKLISLAEKPFTMLSVSAGRNNDILKKCFEPKFKTASTEEKREE